MDAATVEGPGTGAPLRGYRVGIAARRGSQAQADALAAVGAEPVLGAVVDALPVAGSEALEASTEETVVEAPAVVVLTSAAGIEGWLTAAEELGRDAALRKVLAAARVVVQGAGTAAAAAALGVAIDGVLADDGDEAGRALVKLADDLGGWPVAVQRDGGPSSPLVEALRRGDVSEFEVVVPAAGLPADEGPARRLIDDLVGGRLQALTVTAPNEVRNLMALARGAGSHDDLVAALNDEVTVVCLTRATSLASASLGLREVVCPERARVGAMVDVLVDHLRGRTQRFELGGVDVTVQGSLAVIDGTEVWLAERERALLAALARRPGMVVPKAELLRRVWRNAAAGQADGHAVEVAVGRLRRRLGPAGAALQTVPRRGYRLVAG